MAIERTTSKAKIEVISRGGHLACKVLRVVESLILVSVLNRFLVHELVSRLYPQQEHKQRNHNQSREMHKQHDAIHAWYARYDMRCVCVLRKKKGWTRQQIGKPSMPLERWDDFGWNRYKDHWKRMHGLQMASKTRMTLICDKQQDST